MDAEKVAALPALLAPTGWEERAAALARAPRPSPRPAGPPGPGAWPAPRPRGGRGAGGGGPGWPGCSTRSAGPRAADRVPSRPPGPARRLSRVTSQRSKAELFLQLHHGPGPLLLPNPWDAGSARLLASLGFTALATTSSGFAATLGRTDQAVSRD